MEKDEGRDITMEALDVLVKNFTINPEFRNANSVERLASSNKELWKVWKKSLPQLKNTLPKRRHASLYYINTHSLSTADRLFYETDLCIYEGTKAPVQTDAWGNPSMFYIDYIQLDEEERSQVCRQYDLDRLDKTMFRIMERIQIGDMFCFGYMGDTYAVVSHPSKNTECVILVPRMYVEKTNDVYAFAFFIPAECTAYMALHSIIPHGDNKPLKIPKIDNTEPIEIPQEVSTITTHDDALRTTPFFTYFLSISNSQKLKAPNTAIHENVLINAEQALNQESPEYIRWILYQHPDNHDYYFDIFGKLFRHSKRRGFRKARPSQLLNLRHSSQEKEVRI